MEIEAAFVSAFIKRSKRDRYRGFLASPRNRRKFTDHLAHFVDFDPNYRLPISANKLRADTIAHELKKRHSPSVVYAISEDSRIDQQELPLADVLEKVVGSGMGTILSCIPRRLAFVETEDDRFILERHDPLKKIEYVRFVVAQKDEDSRLEKGIFQAVAQAIEWGSVTGADADELNELRAWFAENLDKPKSFGRANVSLGICWFKTAATEHIARIRKMAAILERHGIHIKKIRTDKPGYVVYEDDHQLVAEPFRKETFSRK